MAPHVKWLLLVVAASQLTPPILKNAGRHQAGRNAAPVMKHARFDMDDLVEGMDGDELVDPGDYEIPAFLPKQAD